MQWMVRPSDKSRRLVSTYSSRGFILNYFVVEQELLLGRLGSVETNYRQDSCCIDGTRKFLLNQVISWATEKPSQNEENNTYWIYSLPGIGKTALAHSICANLHKGNHLAGAFFCQRDVGNLNDPRNIGMSHLLFPDFSPFFPNIPEL